MAMIKFLCPNGHPLNSPPHLVGKAGKCPKCGTAFIVPSPEEEPEPPNTEHAAEHDDNSGPGTSDSQTGLAPANQLGHEASAEFSSAASGSSSSQLGSGKSSVSSKPKVETFYFLCPNGHKLNGPVTLKGKLGQCPHCGSKFHIPADEPEEEEASLTPTDEEPEYHSVDENDDAFGGLNLDDLIPVSPPASAPEQEEVIEAELLDLPPTPEEESLAPEEPAGPSESFKHYHPPELDEPEFAHPLAEILKKVWASKTEEGEVELTLENNQKFLPDFFSPQLSKRDFAVFATYDGVSYTLHSFPWSAIRHCTMTKIEDLPPGLFEVK
jgi:hypothetical protein